MFINILVFYFYDYNLKSQKRIYDSKLFEHQNIYYKNQLKILNNTHEEIKSIRHDMKNHLLYLLSDNNNTDNTKKYLENILKLVDDTSKNIQTGNQDFDSYMNYKIDNFSQIGTKLEIVVNCPTGNFVDTFDVITILGNLLDNAFDALYPIENKYLFLNIDYTLNNFVILIKNTFDGKINKDLKTKKSDKLNHGYGIKNVKRIISKYNGIFNITTENDLFVVKIILFKL
jgi:sensor histidine kinase regulating citrate/malate metabolism